MRPVTALASAAWIVAAFSTIACLQQVSTGTGTTDGTSPPAATGASGSTVPSGTGCATDGQSGVTLCEQTSVCPGVSVDQGSLPGCGFRLHPGLVIDLECLCGGDLCAMGVPDTCAEASQLVSSATVLSVCEAASQGGCVSVSNSDGGSGSPSPSPTATTAPNGCDKTCESECAGEPNCIQLCGC